MSCAAIVPLASFEGLLSVKLTCNCSAGLLHPAACNLCCLCAGLKAERAQFADVSAALEKVVLERGLQLHVPWLNKCIQLYETYLVRHGIMLVGPSGGLKWWGGCELGTCKDIRVRNGNLGCGMFCPTGGRNFGW